MRNQWRRMRFPLTRQLAVVLALVAFAGCASPPAPALPPERVEYRSADYLVLRLEADATSSELMRGGGEILRIDDHPR